MESANVKFDEYTKVHEVEPMKEIEEYKSFVYFYEGMPTEENATNQVTNQQQVLVTVQSCTMNVKLHSGIELHSGVELQNEVEAHSDSEISVHERDVELPDRNVHSDSEVERPSEETREEPRLSKYVKRHHLAAQIIGDKDARPMTRNKLRNDTGFLSMQEPKMVKDSLEDVDWSKAMKEEIGQIEKNKTWTLVPRPEDKNVIGTKWI